MSYNDIEIVDEGNTKIITNNNFVIVYNKKTEELTVNSNIKVNLDFCNDLCLNVSGDLDISMSGDFNIYSSNDVSIDSKCLYLNSGASKQAINKYKEEWDKRIEQKNIQQLENTNARCCGDK